MDGNWRVVLGGRVTWKGLRVRYLGNLQEPKQEVSDTREVVGIKLVHSWFLLCDSWIGRWGDLDGDDGGLLGGS